MREITKPEEFEQQYTVSGKDKLDLTVKDENGNFVENRVDIGGTELVSEFQKIEKLEIPIKEGFTTWTLKLTSSLIAAPTSRTLRIDFIFNFNEPNEHRIPIQIKFEDGIQYIEAITYITLDEQQ